MSALDECRRHLFLAQVRNDRSEQTAMADVETAVARTTVAAAASLAPLYALMSMKVSTPA